MPDMRRRTEATFMLWNLETTRTMTKGKRAVAGTEAMISARGKTIRDSLGVRKTQ